MERPREVCDICGPRRPQMMHTSFAIARRQRGSLCRGPAVASVVVPRLARDHARHSTERQVRCVTFMALAARKWCTPRSRSLAVSAWASSAAAPARTGARDRSRSAPGRLRRQPPREPEPAIDPLHPWKSSHYFCRRYQCRLQDSLRLHEWTYRL